MSLCLPVLSLLAGHQAALAAGNGMLAGPFVFGGGVLAGVAVVTSIRLGRRSRRQLSPRADQPGADQPGADQPGADQPAADQPGPGGSMPSLVAEPAPAPAQSLPVSSLTEIPGLRVGVLGALTINGQAGGVVPAQSQLILALALAGSGGISNRQLCERLGPDPDHPKPTDSLRQLIARTRRQLGRAADGREWIEHLGCGQYALHPGATTDWLEFDALAELGLSVPDAALLAEALSMVRGEPFAECYYWWIDLAMVEAARSRIVTVAAALAEIGLASHDPAAAARAARLGLVADASAEPLWRALMRAEHAAGSLAGVREAWTRCQTTMADIAADGLPESATAVLYDTLVNIG